MANTNPPPTPAENLVAVLQTYSNTAAAAYTATVDMAHGEPGDRLGPGGAPVDEKEIQQAQAKNTAAFSQLVTAAKLESEQRERDGYLAVVKLMQETAETADKVCTKLREVLHADAPGSLPQATDVPVIDALAGVLRALAELSPDSVWQTPPTPANQ